MTLLEQAIYLKKEIESNVDDDEKDKIKEYLDIVIEKLYIIEMKSKSTCKIEILE